MTSDKMLGERQSSPKPPNNSICNTIVLLGFSILSDSSPTAHTRAHACCRFSKAYTRQQLRLVTRQGKPSLLLVLRPESRSTLLWCGAQIDAHAQEKPIWLGGSPRATAVQGRLGARASRSSLTEWVRHGTAVLPVKLSPRMLGA